MGHHCPIARSACWLVTAVGQLFQCGLCFGYQFKVFLLEARLLSMKISSRIQILP